MPADDFNQSVFNSEAENFINTQKISSTSFVSNVTTKLALFKSNNFLFPVSINETEYTNSYVCSPFTALVPYATQECKKLNNAFLKLAINAFMPLLGSYCKKRQINRVLQINNWLLSTNLYPKSWTGDTISQQIDNLVRQYPDHTIMLRSLTHHSNSILIDNLTDAGFELIPSRQVYLYDQTLHPYSTRNNIKNDYRLLKKTLAGRNEYQRIDNDDIQANWIPRILELYNMLYLQKYSVHNPMFTEGFLQYALKSNLFNLEVFMNRHGQIDAVGGRIQVDQTCTLPLVGYDTHLGKQKGLYRLVLASATDYALKNDLIFHASAGAAEFKRLRGGIPYIEYSAIYIKHLDPRRQIVWRRLAKILNRYIVPIMKKQQL